MRRYVSSALLCCMLGLGPVHALEVTPLQRLPRLQPSGDWIAFAASTDGRVFRWNGGTESSARNAAWAECERMTLRACNAISVQTQTDVSVVNCVSGNRRESFLGGSNINMGGARWLATDKAKKAGYDEDECREIFTY